MKNKITLFIFLLATGTTLFSQDRYKVVYDYEKDTIAYLRLKKGEKEFKPISRPKFKRNSLIEIKLKNINPFAVEIQPEIRENDAFREGNTYNITNLFGGITGLSSSSNLGLKINIPDTQESDSSQIESKRKIRGNSALLETQVRFINDVSQDIDAAKRLLIADLINPNTNKDYIKTHLINFLNSKIAQSAAINDKATKEDIIPFISAVKNKVKQAIDVVSDEIEVFEDDYYYLDLLEAESMQKLQSQNKDVSKQHQKLRSINRASTNLEELSKKVESSEETTLENLDLIEEFYTALQSASFEQTIDKQVKLDKMNVKLHFSQSSFYERVGLERSDKNIREREINIFARGGLKINTSVALTLNTFGSNSNDYFVDTETREVGADENDYFVPSIATLINFYPFMGENFNIGGSFGLSIPITDDITGVNFLLGPTFFFGSDNRISFSGGVAYGPTEELRNGVKVGETFNGESNKLTRSIYDFGYYFGISFSLFNVKN